MKKFIEEAYKMRGLRYYSYQECPELVESMPKACRKAAGFCCNIEGRNYVFVDESRRKDRVQEAKAHEMGHILLGHLDQDENLEPEAAEREAEIFGVFMYALSLYDEYLQRGRDGEADLSATGKERPKMKGGNTYAKTQS